MRASARSSSFAVGVAQTPTTVLPRATTSQRERVQTSAKAVGARSVKLLHRWGNKEEADNARKPQGRLDKLGVTDSSLVPPMVSIGRVPPRR